MSSPIALELKTSQVLDFDRDHQVPEMHDRIIVGLSRRLGAPLIASDPKIVLAGLTSIVW